MEYLVEINGKVSRICKHEADVVNFCINHAYDFSKFTLWLTVMPLLPDGRAQDKTYNYLWTFSAYHLDYTLKSLDGGNKKPFLNRKGSLVDFVIE